jgi:tRNA dimethylallyltransferase
VSANRASGDSTVSDVIVVVGATGTGKSGLSLDLAEGLARRGLTAEIVNADAMQLYRGMDIGTAKLPVAERREIPHHLLDVLDVTEENSVADYQTRARAQIDAILKRKNVPILVGGSGLYVSSVIFDFTFPGTDPVIRARLEAELVSEGPGALYRTLKLRDEAAAQAIGSQNGRRLVRALEVLEMTGSAVSGTLPDASAEWRTSTCPGPTWFSASTNEWKRCGVSASSRRPTLCATPASIPRQPPERRSGTRRLSLSCPVG